MNNSAAGRPALPKRVTMPPPPAKRLRVFGMLLLVLALCLPPIVVEMARPDVTQGEELDVLLPARQTWAQSGGAVDGTWWQPRVNGKPQYTRSPLSVWTTMLSWTGMDPQSATTDALVLRARLVSMALGLLVLAGTYWAGYSLGGVRVGRMGAMVVGTGLLFVRYARFDSADLHLMAWVTLSVAAALWAMRPMQPKSRLGRRVAGWLIAGVTLGAALLAKGPVALVFVAVPLVGAIVVTRTRRLGNSFGLLFALLLGLLVAAPWYLQTAEMYEDALTLWLRAWRGSVSSAEPAYYYLLLLMMVFPWSVCLVAALFQPFMRASGTHRRRLLIAWMWFVALFVLLSVPVAKEYRYALPLLPAMGLLVAQLWAYHVTLAGEGIPDPGINFLRVPHWVLVVGGSAGYPAFVLLQEDMIARGWMDRVELPGLSLPVMASVGGVLLVVAVLGAVYHWRWKPGQAFVATFVWMLVALTVGYFSYSRSHHSVQPARLAAEQVREVAGGLSLWQMAAPEDADLNDAMLFYIGEPVMAVTEQTALRPIAQPGVLIVRSDAAIVPALVENQYQLIGRLDHGPGYELYRTPQKTPVMAGW